MIIYATMISLVFLKEIFTCNCDIYLNLILACLIFKANLVVIRATPVSNEMLKDNFLENRTTEYPEIKETTKFPHTLNSPTLSLLPDLAKNETLPSNASSKEDTTTPENNINALATPTPLSKGPNYNSTISNVSTSKVDDKLDATTIVESPEVTTVHVPENITLPPSNSSLTTSTPLPVEEGSSASSHVIIAFVILALLAAVCYGLYKLYRKRQLHRLRTQLMPVYNFDPMETDDWESNLLEDEFSLKIKQKNNVTESQNDPNSATSTSHSSSGPIRQRSSVPVTHL